MRLDYRLLPKRSRNASWIAAQSACLALVALGGCGSKTNESFVPQSDHAKSSLERVLTAWQSGTAGGRIEPVDGGPAIQAVDSDWNAGRKLQKFEITGELPRDSGPRRFSVRLTLVGAIAPVETEYYVVGQDPLWIFRDRDYMQTKTM
jgi:hypothetical protein